jgi:hypothetical protein
MFVAKVSRVKLTKTARFPNIGHRQGNPGTENDLETIATVLEGIVTSYTKWRDEE